MNLIIKPWTLGKCLISKASLTRTSSRTSIKSSNESPKLNFPKTCYGSEYSLPPERQHFKDSEEEESGVNISLTFNSLVPLFSHEIRDSSNEKLGNADHPLQEFNFPSPFYRTNPILGEQHLRHLGRNTLVLDLDETLVHSSLNALNHYSFVLPVKTLELQPIFVAKRPGVELFLKTLANLYEIVIFTASVSDYANPLIDILDPFHFCTWRLFREHCVIKNGRLVKDLSLLGRDLKNVIILDNSPESFALQPKNGIRVKTWLGDKHDTELFRLLPILEALAYVKDICHALTSLEKLGKQEHIKSTSLRCRSISRPRLECMQRPVCNRLSEQCEDFTIACTVETNDKMKSLSQHLKTDFWAQLEKEVSKTIPKSKQAIFLDRFKRNHAELKGELNLERIDSFAKEVLKLFEEEEEEVN